MHLCQWKLNVHEHFDHAYLVSTYAEAFRGKAITPVMPQHVLSVKGVQPPPLYARCGRPKGRGRPVKQRITSKGEATNHTHKATCSICKLPGHNVVSCTNFAPSVPISNSDYKEASTLLGICVKHIGAPTMCILHACMNSIHAHRLCAAHSTEIEGKQQNPVSASDVLQWGEKCDNANTK